MTAELGQYGLLLALLTALFQGTLPLIGAARGQRLWMDSAVPAGRAQFIFLAIAFCALIEGFIENDFSILYVASHSNSALPLYYRIAATWGAHEGSMLLWAFILSGWTLAVTLFSGGLTPVFRARVLGTMGLISFGILLLWTIITRCLVNSFKDSLSLLTSFWIRRIHFSKEFLSNLFCFFSFLSFLFFFPSLCNTFGMFRTNS